MLDVSDPKVRAKLETSNVSAIKLFFAEPRVVENVELRNLTKEERAELGEAIRELHGLPKPLKP